MARRVSPYVATKGRANLMDKLLASRTGAGKTRIGTAKQKKKMSKEFEEETQVLYDKAQREGKSKYGDLLKVGGLAATIFGGPLGAFLVNSLITQYMGEKQQKASKTLLGLDMDRWGKSFLSGAGDKYMAGAEEQQISSGKVLQDSLLAGGMAALSSGMVGGTESLGAQMTKAAKDGISASASSTGTALKGVEASNEVFKETLKGMFTGVDKAGNALKGGAAFGKAAQGMVAIPSMIAPYTKDWQSEEYRRGKKAWYKGGRGYSRRV